LRQMLRRFFRRKRLTPAELAERERLRSEAQKARHSAEAEMAVQRGRIEGFSDTQPPAGPPF
jgi:methylphosphotriester-DNA--protein-cysteine methyltransferase